MKIEGYETRLYWQFRYCDEHDGQAFFYTLTYNDSNLPNHYGINCFDYNDLTDLVFEGSFRKQLLRQYGTKMKYFVGAELGDGKGKRGMHNNPHYHILFFLENAHSDRYPYVKIDPEEFRHLVRMMWQGFDEDEDKKNGVFHDYTEAKKGIAREGENCGKVTDYRACMYCAKYVCKDAKLIMAEDKVRKYAKMTYRKALYHPDNSNNSLANDLARNFFFDVLCKMYKTRLEDKVTRKGKVHKGLTYSELVHMLCSNLPCSTFLLNQFMPNYDKEPLVPITAFRWFDVITAVVKSAGLWQEYADYRRCYMEKLVQETVNTWRNVYTNKVRCSQGIGSYALEFIDPMNPSVQVPKKKGFKNRPLPMYYYRKLYMNVVKDPKGQNLYVLNDLGKEYKLSRLSKQVNKLSEKASNYAEMALDRDFFNKVRESDCNTTSFMKYSDFLNRMYYLSNEEKIQLYERYAEYKLVYENRFFQYQFNGSTNIDDMPALCLAADYARFLVPAYYTVDYDDSRLYQFIENPPEGWLPYSQHPYFLRYLGFFALFDSIADYLFVQKDNKSQKDAEERAATRRYHKERELKAYYLQFRCKKVEADLPF